MSSSNYSRNKYRCLLKPNVNVFHLDNNINSIPKIPEIPENIPPPSPQPRIYPYGYPGYPGSYPLEI